MIRYAALLCGLVIVGLGLLGVTVPETFMAALQFFHVGNCIYLAALLRVVVGVVFMTSARDSRWPRAMAVTGFGVTALGLLTPVSKNPIPSVAWGWWSPNFIGPWAFSCMALGLFVVVAVVPPRDHDD